MLLKPQRLLNGILGLLGLLLALLGLIDSCAGRRCIRIILVVFVRREQRCLYGILALLGLKEPYAGAVLPVNNSFYKKNE